MGLSIIKSIRYAFVFLLIVITLAGNSGSAAINPQLSNTTEQVPRENISRRTVETLSGGRTSVWTKEMMEKAQPYPIEISNEKLELSYTGSVVNETPVIIPGSLPSTLQNQSDSTNESGISLSSSSSGYEYPPPFVRYKNFDNSQETPIPNNNYNYYPFPYSAVGVIFFFQGGAPFRCSAATIGSNAIWTAGHCIHKGDGELDDQGNVIDEGTWSTNVIFIPGYQAQDDPNYDYGSWASVELWITPEWLGSQDLRFDMGGAVLQTYDPGNMKVSDVVGHLGFAYNLGSAQHWVNIGYPSAAPFDGSSQHICAGSFAYEDLSMGDPNTDPLPVAMGCDMTRGSSGGPWIINLSGSQTLANILNGNNSYRYTYHPDELFSPYFGAAAGSLYNDLVNSSATN